MFRHILLSGLVAFASINTVGQTTGRHYWTKTVLATASTCKLRIGDGLLSPGEANCTYSGHLAANTKVLLKSFGSSGSWRKVDLLNGSGTTFSIEISDSGRSSFQQIFDKLFAQQSSDDHEPSCNGKVLKDYLFSVGFPDQLSRNQKGEEWHLSANHMSVQSCGFDMATLKFVSGKLVSVTGSI